MTLEEQYLSAYDMGYAGVMAWTSNGVSGYGEDKALADITPAIQAIKALENE
jgi:hypothetical protein